MCSSSRTTRPCAKWSSATSSGKGIVVDAVGDGESALASAERPMAGSRRARPDVATDRRLRSVPATCARTPPVPVIMLTARGDEDDRVLGSRAGRRRLRRQAVFAARADGARESSVATGRHGDCRADDAVPASIEHGRLRDRRRARASCVVDGTPVTFTAREFDLSCFLPPGPRQAFRREELLEHVWGYTYGDTSTVTVHVRRIREKVEDDPERTAPSR